MKERVACMLLKSRAPIIELAEACYRFSPQIAVRDNEAIFLEIGACRNLYTEHSLLMRLGVLAHRFGLMAQVGFGDTVPAALTSARFAGYQRQKIPLEALHDYAGPFGHDEETYGRVNSLIATMRMLGIETLEEFSRLPTKTLASRFGSAGVELSHRVNNRLPLAWPRFKPAEKICEKAELHELSEFPSCSSLEPLLFVIKNVADRAMARLRGRAQRLATLDILLDLEKGTRQWKVELPVPQGSVAGLLPILRERLSFDFAREPLEQPIVRITLNVLETVPGHRSQRDLFNADGENAEAWDALVGRLCQKLGKDRAFVANPVDRYLPEKAWQRALEALDRLPTEIPPRPARILKKPQPLRQEGHYLVPASTAQQARSIKRWRVSEWHGPERISVEWWMDPKLQGYNRDYFRLVTENGEQLWVFSVPSRPGYYLHGFFD